FMPEPQTLLMVVQPTPLGRPAASDAWRAGAWPRLAGSTQPMITSDTSSTLMPACSIAPRIAVAPRVGVGTPVNWPSMEPMAVRLAPTMTMSLMEDSGTAWGSGIIAPARVARQTGAGTLARPPEWRYRGAGHLDPVRRDECDAGPGEGEDVGAGRGRGIGLPAGGLWWRWRWHPSQPAAAGAAGATAGHPAGRATGGAGPRPGLRQPPGLDGRRVRARRRADRRRRAHRDRRQRCQPQPSGDARWPGGGRPHLRRSGQQRPAGRRRRRPGTRCRADRGGRASRART